MHRHILLIALITATIISCKKTSSTGTQPTSGNIDSALAGSWWWILTVNNGITSGNWSGNPTGDSVTPSSSGIYDILTFNANGTWSLTQNNDQVSQGTFKADNLLFPAGILTGLELDLTPTNGKDSILNFTLSHDTLTLSQPKIDSVGRNWIYVRSAGVLQSNTGTTRAIQ